MTLKAYPICTVYVHSGNLTKAYKHVLENLASVGFSGLCNSLVKIIIIIVLLSRCSIRFSMLLAKKNPVVTLAMLILFSYTKLLRTVIIYSSVQGKCTIY